MTITINGQTLLTIGVAIIAIFAAAKILMYVWDGEKPSHKTGLYHGDKEAIAREMEKRTNRDGDENKDGVIMLIFFVSALILVLVAPFL